MVKCVECKYFKGLALGGYGICLLKYVEKKEEDAKKEINCNEFDRKHWGDRRSAEYFVEQYHRTQVQKQFIKYRRIEIIALIITAIVAVLGLILHFIKI
jgi:hypothetical protein